MKKILMVSVLLSMVACMPPEWVFMRSYIMSYFDCEDIRLNVSSNYPNSFFISPSGKTALGDYKSTGPEKEAYDALCEKHGDMTYNRKVNINDGGYYSIDCIGVDFVSIDIVSDADFDDTHPAGTSLGDIAVFHSTSVKPYIDKSYLGYENTRIEQKVSELTLEQMTLLGENSTSGLIDYSIGIIEFLSEPSASKTHNFTVRMDTDDGKTFSNTITMIFE